MINNVRIKRAVKNLELLGKADSEDMDDFINFLLANGIYRIFKSKEKALQSCEDGDKVRIGYPNSHIVYRVSMSRDIKTFNFMYIVSK